MNPDRLLEDFRLLWPLSWACFSWGLAWMAVPLLSPSLTFRIDRPKGAGHGHGASARALAPDATPAHGAALPTGGVGGGGGGNSARRAFSAALRPASVVSLANFETLG